MTPFAVVAFVLHASCGGQAFGGPATGDGGGEADGCQGAACTTDSGGACKCVAALAPMTPNYACADGTTGGPFCDIHPDGTCDWANRSCTPACRGLGCDPQCPNGVLKDVNGCDTCTCAPAAEGGIAGTPCKYASDCGGTYLCGFPEAAACAATGTCFAAEPVACNAYSAGCGCDGANYNVVCNGLPSGYAPAPLFHAGACAHDHVRRRKRRLRGRMTREAERASATYAVTDAQHGRA